MEIRTGHGFDVHRFTEGDHVWLCGVKHPAQGAGWTGTRTPMWACTPWRMRSMARWAEGDIGTHFPPTDPQWKGAESHVFLDPCRRPGQRDRGGRIDERGPDAAVRGRPRSNPMPPKCALGWPGIIGTWMPGRVSVKATTMERMGFIGREEGMGCIANVTLEVPA